MLARSLLSRCLIFVAAGLSSMTSQLPVVQAEVKIVKDVSYLGPDRKEKADLYLPDDAEGEGPARHPGIVIIHGGGWTGGDKGAAREQNIGRTLAANGYVCMSINYLLQPKEGERIWPRNLQDCKTAVCWLRANAQRLHIDTEHIGVIGGSAGGHLALMVGVTDKQAGLDPPQAESLGQSCRVQAVIDLYGPIADTPRWSKTLVGRDCADAPELCRQVTPLSHLDASDPPILVMHGTADTTVDIRDSKVIDAALEKAGIEHQLVIVEGAPHSFHFQPKQQDLRPIALAFLNKHLKGQSTAEGQTKPTAENNAKP